MAFIRFLTLQNMLQNPLRQLPHQGLTVAMSLARNHEISIQDERIKTYLIQEKVCPRTSLSIEILQESIAQSSSRTSSWNLTPIISEMLGQIYQIQKIIGERVSNVVIMGTGEPLDNYNNFLKFIHILTDEHGLNISQRNVTVSTCGIVPKILELAEERLQITLALSLHGSTQEKRRKLMPVANKYELGEVLSACDTYFKKTGRRVTFEYSLVHEVNDTDEDAKELSELLAPRNCHLNLIPVNPVKERSFQRPSRKSALNFKNKLEKSGINVTIRREMGSDIDGACGQLRRRYEEETMNEN